MNERDVVLQWRPWGKKNLFCFWGAGCRFKPRSNQNGFWYLMTAPLPVCCEGRLYFSVSIVSIKDMDWKMTNQFSPFQHKELSLALYLLSKFLIDPVTLAYFLLPNWFYFPPVLLWFFLSMSIWRLAADLFTEECFYTSVMYNWWWQLYIGKFFV